MKCYNCGKEMDRENGGPVFRGVEVNVTVSQIVPTEATTAYNNLQFGKYGDGKGECHVAICYECYIDILFGRSGLLTLLAPKST